MPPDCEELRSLIAKGLQRANPKPDALGRKPGFGKMRHNPVSIPPRAFLSRRRWLASLLQGGALRDRQGLRLVDVGSGSKAALTPPKRDFRCYPSNGHGATTVACRFRAIRESLGTAKRKCLANLTKKSAGWKPRRNCFQCCQSYLFKRSLTGKRYHVVLRARAAAHANRADHLAVDHQQIAAA